MASLSGGAALEAALAKIASGLEKGASVEVGFFEGATEDDGTPVALVAALNEFGTSRIPPRPFFRNAIAKNSSKWPTNIAAALKANNYDAAVALKLVGDEIVSEIQDSIRSNTPPPNAPSTVAAKGSDSTLRDSGVMLRSVAYVVKS